MIALEWLFFTIAPCDAAEPWQLGFQDAATPMMQGIIDLHHDIFFFLILILVFVSWILVRALWHFHSKKNPIPQRIVHGTTIEILWTIFPSIILMFIAIPSFALLYSMDEVVVDPAITIKAIGHQWYWTYEYSDYNSSDEQSLTFDSYMIPEDDLELGQLRLLEVDNRVVVPAKTHIRIIVTSADVLHSWVVPPSGVSLNMDIPGRVQGGETGGAGPSGQAPNPDPLAPEPVDPAAYVPLMDDNVRYAELRDRLDLNLILEGLQLHQDKIDSILDSQLNIEKAIEKALLSDGYSRASVFSERHKIRGYIFYPRGRPLSPSTYSLHLREVRHGTHRSIPYRRLCEAIYRDIGLLKLDCERPIKKYY